MKRKIRILCGIISILILLFSVSACTESNNDNTPSSTNSADDTGKPDNAGNNNILIAYFTWAENTIVENPAAVDVDAVASASVLLPGNAGIIAQFIQEETGADMFQIIVTELYSSNYDECLARATEEYETDARPALAENVENIADYDVIFLGFPNWYYSVPMAILTFIDNHDLSGKTIIPFCAHGTGGLAQSISHITEALPDDVTILEAFGVYRPNVVGSQNAVNDWLAGLGIDY
jgi:flavodoxin